MNNTEFDNTLKKLEGQVSQFSSVATDFEIPKNNSILSKIDFKSNVIYYVLVPIIIMIIFYIFKFLDIFTVTIFVLNRRSIRFSRSARTRIISTNFY